jgi:hypothetical protein
MANGAVTDAGRAYSPTYRARSPGARPAEGLSGAVQLDLVLRAVGSAAALSLALMVAPANESPSSESQDGSTRSPGGRAFQPLRCVQTESLPPRRCSGRKGSPGAKLTYRQHTLATVFSPCHA